MVATKGKKKRILFFITSLKNSGAERQFFYLIRGINSLNKYDILVLSLVDGPYRKKLEELGVKVRFLNISSILHMKKANKFFCENVEKFKPKVVQSFLSLSNVIAKYNKKKYGYKLLISLRAKQAIFVHFNLMEKILDSNTDYTIVNANETASFFKDKFKIDKNKIKVIYNGFDFNKMKKKDFSKLKSKYNGKIILTVANFRRQKDYGTNLKALAELNKSYKNFSAIYLGEGEKIRKFKEICGQYGLKDKVYFLGNVDNVFDYYSIADLFFFPTLYEGQANVLIEAQYFNLPIVTTDLRENREIIRGTYILVKKRDYLSMAKAIKKLLNKKDVNKKNRDYIVDTFSIDRMVFDYDKLYEELLKDVRN